MKNLRNYLLFGLVFTILTVSCKDNTTGTTEEKEEEKEEVIDLTEPLGKLPGDDNESVTKAVFNFSVPSEATEENISVIVEDGIEQRILRSEIEVTVISDATTGQFNDLLSKYDAKIVVMAEGRDYLILQVPDPGSSDALFNLIERLEEEEIIQYALESAIIEKIDLETSGQKEKIPDHLTGNNLYKVENHLSIRAHAAWNLQNLIERSSKGPSVLVVDWFGDGKPGVGFNVDVEESDFDDKDPDSHGYWVLGILTGNHAYQSSLSDNANDVTGMYPEQLKVRAQDMASERFTTYNRRMNRIINQIEEILSSDPNANIILNTSWGDPSRNNERLAYNWISKVRGNSEAKNLEDNFIHFTAAGNYKTEYGRYAAKDNSPFSFAAMESPEFLGFKRDRLSNIFVVENRVPSISEMGTLRSTPGCANYNSIMGGNISAIGSSVFSFENSLDGTKTATGTSASTPQAAGVAALVWAIDPNLTVNEVQDIIIKTSEALPITSDAFANCNSEVPQPVVDAYAAILAAGGDNARSNLLDVNEDDFFNENDIDIFLTEFDSKKGELNYSRYDLNGSGQTGGSSIERFDLNNDIQFGTVSQSIQGNEIEFNENELTDNNILCYYSYSDLFEGDTESRNDLLEGICYESITKPFVTTSSISTITENSAQSGGSITDDGGASVTQRGVCWSTSQNPDLNDNCTNDGTGVGEYISKLTGLSAETEYYVRAYATNDQGTDYGNQHNFTTEQQAEVPSVNTSPITLITENSAQSGGNVTSDGGDSVTTRGVCWSTSQNPTTSDYCTSDGSGIGEFTSNITSLSPNTEYFVRTFASNEVGTGYGEEINFTTESESSNGDWPRDTTTEVVDVYNPATGRTWMDRNLGASRAATSLTDAQAYGDLYQWGRAADGHQKRNSFITSTVSSSDQPGHDRFILSSSSPYDWRSPKNDNLWQGESGVNNPCPEGYRMPTAAEWEAERQSWYSNDENGAFASPLKLNRTGQREFSDGSLHNVGSGGFFWSSTVDGSYPQRMFFDSYRGSVRSYYRAGGFAVRCIKD